MAYGEVQGGRGLVQLTAVRVWPARFRNGPDENSAADKLPEQSIPSI